MGMPLVASFLCLSTIVGAQKQDGLDHRRQLFSQVRAQEGGYQPADTQRWVGAQSPDGNKAESSICTFKVPLDSEIEMMPNASLGQAHYIYCDLHHFWPDGFFTQFVPQLQRGDMTCSSTSDYDIGGCDHTEAWYIQAQYIWSESVGPSTADSAVKGWVGEMLEVQPGQTISTSISYTSCGGTMGWNLQISADGDTPSSLCVTAPFMGRNSKYSAPYASGGTADYWEFILGDLHEAWNMNSAGYYPTSMTVSVDYHGKDGASFNAGEADQNACDNQSTQKSCADNVMIPDITTNDADTCTFTLKRDNGIVTV